MRSGQIRQHGVKLSKAHDLEVARLETQLNQ